LASRHIAFRVSSSVLLLIGTQVDNEMRGNLGF
jgi:hypothetical protein